MNMIRQIFIVTALNFKSLPQRFWTSMVIVVGLGATIGVLLSIMSMTYQNWNPWRHPWLYNWMESRGWVRY